MLLELLSVWRLSIPKLGLIKALLSLFPEQQAPALAPLSPDSSAKELRHVSYRSLHHVP